MSRRSPGVAGWLAARTGSRCLVNIPLYCRPSHFQSDFYNFLFEKSLPSASEQPERDFCLLFYYARVYIYTCLSFSVSPSLVFARSLARACLPIFSLLLFPSAASFLVLHSLAREEAGLDSVQRPPFFSTSIHVRLRGKGGL